MARTRKACRHGTEQCIVEHVLTEISHAYVYSINTQNASGKHTRYICLHKYLQRALKDIRNAFRVSDSSR